MSLAVCLVRVIACGAALAVVATVATAQDPAANDDPARAAVWPALDWLARHQHADGFWHPDTFDTRCNGAKCSGKGVADGQIGATALAVLAFVGAGETFQSGDHKATVKNALKALRDAQDDSGFVGPKSSANSRLGDAWATLALAEAYGLSGSKVLKGPAVRAVSCLASMQATSGGWKLDEADGECDLMLTCACVQALRAAKAAELEVEAATFERAIAWLDSVADAKTGAVRPALSPRTPKFSDHALVGASAAARLFARWDAAALAKDTIFEKQCALLAASPPSWDEKGADADLVAWTSASSALFQQGGSAWKAWWDAFGKTISARLHVGDSRCDRGSWDAVDPRVPFGGRVAATALLCRASETPHLYRRLEPK